MDDMESDYSETKEEEKEKKKGGKKKEGRKSRSGRCLTSLALQIRHYRHELLHVTRQRS